MITRTNEIEVLPVAPGTRVLIIEDNLPLRDLMADVLELEGCTVTEAIDISDVRTYLQIEAQEPRSGRPFDLIITDIPIPRGSALDSLQTLRREGCHVPAIVVTAFPEWATKERTRQLKATLLPKPFTLAEFRRVTSAALHSHESSGKG